MRTATVFNFLVESSLIGSMLILCTLILRAAFRRHLGSRCLMTLWLLIALRLLLPIALPNPVMNWLKPALSADAGIRPMADQIRVRVGDAAHALYWKTLGSDTSSSILRSLVWRMVYTTRTGQFARVAFAVYLTGAMLVLCWSIGRSALFRISVKTGDRGALPPAQEEAFHALCRQYRLKHPPRVRLVSQIPGSCVFGLFRPTIFLPAEAAPDDLTALMAREICSIRRHDPLRAALRNLCCILHWFNPLVWLGAWLCRLDMALATDARVTAAMTDAQRRAYAQPLIHTAETRRARPSMLVAATPFTLRGRQLALRIRLILHPARPYRSAQALFCVCCALTLCTMFATAEQPTLANLPTLTTPSLRQEPITLSTAEDAQRYAAAFLALEGIEADDGFVDPTLTRTADGWFATWYVPGAQTSSQLAFTDSGEILGYASGEVLPDSLQPLPRPITTHNGEGQQWCAFLSALIQRQMHELWNDYEAMEIDSSGRLDGMQYITVSLLDHTGEAVWQAIIQVAPTGRLISLMPVVG